MRGFIQSITVMYLLCAVVFGQPLEWRGQASCWLQIGKKAQLFENRQTLLAGKGVQLMVVFNY